MGTAVSPDASEVAMELTGRSHLSFSAVRTYVGCPLRWHFRYVLALPEESVPASLAFGAAIHWAIEGHFRALMRGEAAPTLDELMDASPGPAVVEKVAAIAATISGVVRVEKCIARKMGHRYFVDMHVEVDPQMTVQRAHQIAHDLEDRVLDHLFLQEVEFFQAFELAMQG